MCVTLAAKSTEVMWWSRNKTLDEEDARLRYGLIFSTYFVWLSWQFFRPLKPPLFFIMCNMHWGIWMCSLFFINVIMINLFKRLILSVSYAKLQSRYYPVIESCYFCKDYNLVLVLMCLCVILIENENNRERSIILSVSKFYCRNVYKGELLYTSYHKNRLTESVY